jgi:hypothetical protein
VQNFIKKSWPFILPAEALGRKNPGQEKYAQVKKNRKPFFPEWPPVPIHYQ